MREACQETMSLINLLKIFTKEELTPVKLYCDNRAAKSSTKISVSNKLRHMFEVREHYVRECVERKLITVRWYGRMVSFKGTTGRYIHQSFTFRNT